MLESIAQARRYVFFEIYLIESGCVAARFIDALSAASTRGVLVKLLLDDFGALKLNAPDRARLRGAGVDLRFYNPLRLRQFLHNLFRDHRKLLIVDGDVAYVSGAGITDDFDSPHNPSLNWRENAVRVCGPVLPDWIELFQRVWERRTETPLDLTPSQETTQTDGMLGRVGVNNAVFLQDIKRALHQHVRRARFRVWIATAYFVPQ